MNKKRLKKICTYTMVAILLLLGFFIIRKLWPHKYGCEASNFAVGSWTAWDGKNYYFAAGGNINKLDQEGNVTCLRENDEGKELLILRLNLVGDWLFYQKWYRGSEAEKMDTIYKMRLDGTEEQEVVAEEWIYYFFVIDRKIYYSANSGNGSEIFVVNNNGENKRLAQESEIISDSRMDAQFRLNGVAKPDYEANYSRYGSAIGEQYEGDWFYVGETIENIDEFYYLRRMSLDGKADERIAEKITDFLVREEGIYCGKEKNGKVYLSKLNHDGSDKEIVLEQEFTYIRWINYVGGKLFFTATTDAHLENMVEYCVNSDGTNLQKLYEYTE